MPYHTLSRIVSIAVLLVSARGVSQGQDEPAELSQTRALYQKDVEFATRPIRDRYLTRLESLKRSLGSRGDARAALVVQEEIDRVKGIGAGLERFAGLWRIKYSNGSTLTYSISPDGEMTLTEDNGKKVAPRTGKITVKGSDCVVENFEGTLERLSIAGDKLSIDYFSPKSTYPTGAPSTRATGFKVLPSKP